jgi:hypothetical protein
MNVGDVRYEFKLHVFSQLPFKQTDFAFNLVAQILVYRIHKHTQKACKNETAISLAIRLSHPTSRAIPHSNPTHCLVPSKLPLHQALYFVHISACGLISCNASGPSKQPAKTITMPLNASASASLLNAEPHSAQEVTIIGKPTSWCDMVTLLRGEELLIVMAGAGSMMAVEYEEPVSLRQLRQWQRACQEGM